MQDIEVPMRHALELAWESACAGSLGIGSVITDKHGRVVATGRNRLAETDPGDDHLAGTSLAHAELNALAKLPWGAAGHYGRLTLWTTLDPCIQCAAAIRMAHVAEVRVLSPDPLFRNVEHMRDMSELVASRWPDHHAYAADPFAVFSLAVQTHAFIFLGIEPSGWMAALPRVAALAHDLTRSGELIGFAVERSPLEVVIDALWPRLETAVPDVAELWKT